MAKNPKMVICRNCNNPISAKAKICPSCGAKNKKPFYKKAWFIILAVIVVIGVIGSIGGGGNEGEKIDWNDIELGSVLPAPKSDVGQILTNSDEHLSIYIHKTSKDDYRDYRAECESLGFTLESDVSDTRYSAYNADGYELALWYNDSDEELHISLDAPMKMGTLQWPTSELVSLLPVPKSTVGIISSESSDRFFVYVGDTSLEDYNAYVSECSAKGFSVDYDKGEKFYNADNAEGYHISVNYQGNNVMSIEIEKPEETPESSEKPEETPNTDGNETPSTSEPETTPDNSSELVDGMRPEFKEAMDSYEEFMDEYCEFMKKYSENPSDIGLLADYAKFMGEYADFVEDFEKWDDGEMNAAETKYYIEVQTRVNQKLLEVAG